MADGHKCSSQPLLCAFSACTQSLDMAQMLRVKIFDNMKPLWFKVDLGGGWLFKFWSGHGNESL